MVHKCGEEPGAGTYTCLNCGQEVTLDENTDKLPPCPKCEECDYE